MVGSTQSIADPNTVLNTIVAEVLCDMADKLEAAEDLPMALHDMIKDTIAHIRESFSTVTDILMNGLLKQREEDFQTSNVW